MRTNLVKLAASALLLVLVSITLAADGGIRTVSGTVVSVDMKAAALVVRPETATVEPLVNVTLSFDDGTKIRKAGLKIKLADIHPGDAVTANFKTDGVRNLALAVLVEQIPR